MFFFLLFIPYFDRKMTCKNTITTKSIWIDMSGRIKDQFDQGLHCLLTYEPRCEKTGLRGLRPGPTQTRLYCDRRWLEA